ncbi:MAG: glycoside hydrolase family 2 protein [Marinilabiliaceae bacterium]|nr:glycoside hydrolase family 2 protein [Marinilabiliaceae bacterium]
MLRSIGRLFVAGILCTLLLGACTSQKTKRSMDLSDANWRFHEKDSSKVLKAKVPGSVHMDLLANGEIPDPYYRNNEKDLQWIGERDWVYSASFAVADELYNMDNLSVQIGGLDTYADVFINDSLVLQADNFFKAWELDGKSFLKKGANSIKIIFNSAASVTQQMKDKSAIPLDDAYAYARKPAYHFGWDWGPVFITSGIWKPIKIEGWNNAKINNLQVVQDNLSDTNAELTCIYEIEADKQVDALITTTCLTNNREVAQTIQLQKGLNTVKVPFSIDNPKRWWSHGLGEAFLYELQGQLSLGSSIADQVNEKIGLRTIQLVQKPDSIGKSFHFELNGVPVFMKGANYIPQDMFLNRPDEKDYQSVIDNALAANMNMLRVWGGGFYENDIFYDLCDENGLLVWQDFMFACSMYPGDEAYLASVRDEAVQNVRRLRNHPCIALWCGNNENYIGWKDWGWSNKLTKKDSAKVWNDYEKLFHQLLPEVVSEYDGDRFYWPSSPLHGWGYPVHKEGDVHYWGIWHAQEPFENFQKKEAIGRFMSEYGFQGCPEMSSIQKFTLPEDQAINSKVMLAHQKHRIGYPVIDKYMEWYYNKPKDFEAYLYVSQIQQAYGMGIAFEAHRRAMPHCMGTLYWQINDCYPVTSWASVDCYGKWKALHYKTRELYKEVLVSPFVKNDTLDVYVVSDRLEAVEAKLELTLYDFAGKVVTKSEEDITMQANTSGIYQRMDVARLLAGRSQQAVFLEAIVKQDGAIIARNHYFFDVPKNLQLSPSTVTVDKVKTEKGLELSFSSDVFAKDVFLSTEDGKGFFSNNFFDLIPGKPVKVLFMDGPQDFKIEDLKIYSLVDSFE